MKAPRTGLGITWRRTSSSYHDAGACKAPHLGAQPFAPITGPGLLTFDLKSIVNQVSLYYDRGIRVESFSAVPADGWKHIASYVPAGAHEVALAASVDSQINPLVRMRNFQFIPGDAYVDWSYGHEIAASPWVDADGDGQVNLLEYGFGTDPNNKNSVVQLALPVGSQLQLPSLPYAATGLHYDIQMSVDLSHWTSIATASPNPANQPGPLVTLPQSNAPKVFYRVLCKF